jgi:Tfp pilus assembly protein PilF
VPNFAEFSYALLPRSISGGLEVLAYPESADAHENLAEAYLADGQKDLARQHAEKALAILDSHTVPASSWTDTEQYRGTIRGGAQDVLKKLNASP